jgi:hypothetical protein
VAGQELVVRVGVVFTSPASAMRDDHPSSLLPGALLPFEGRELRRDGLPAFWLCLPEHRVAQQRQGLAPHVDDAVNKGDSGGVFEEVDVDFVEADGFGSWLLP